MIQLPRYNTIQIIELLEHQYYMSEKVGYEMPIQITSNDWYFNHAANFSKRYVEHNEAINNYCDSVCGVNKCQGFKACSLNEEKGLDKIIHKLLED
ncbi:MAG: hypothetical protein ACFFKA_13985 [Candidatus Thorarchaeota archaeon]